MTNLFKQLQSLLPPPPVLVGIVREIHDDDTSTVEIPGNLPLTGYGDGTVVTGSLIRPRGSHVPVGQRAFVRAGVIETRAPDTDPIDIPVGSVVFTPPEEEPEEPAEGEALLYETFTGSGSMNGLAPDVGPAGLVWTQAGFAPAAKNGAGYFETTGSAPEEIYFLQNFGVVDDMTPIGVFEIKWRRKSGGTADMLTVSLRDGGFEGLPDMVQRIDLTISGTTTTSIELSCLSDSGDVDEFESYTNGAANEFSTTTDDVIRLEIDTTEQRLYVNGVLKITMNADLTGLPHKVNAAFIDFEGRIDYLFLGSASDMEHP